MGLASGLAADLVSTPPVYLRAPTTLFTLVIKTQPAHKSGCSAANTMYTTMAEWRGWQFPCWSQISPYVSRVESGINTGISSRCVCSCRHKPTSLIPKLAIFCVTFLFYTTVMLENVTLIWKIPDSLSQNIFSVQAEHFYEKTMCCDEVNIMHTSLDDTYIHNCSVGWLTLWSLMKCYFWNFLKCIQIFQVVCMKAQLGWLLCTCILGNWMHLCTAASMV